MCKRTDIWTYSHHEWVHVVGLGFQIATISHPILIQDAIILHSGNISPLEKLQQKDITISHLTLILLEIMASASLQHIKRLAGHNFNTIMMVSIVQCSCCLPVHLSSVCEAAGLPLPSFFSSHLCWETCSCSSWVVHCPYPDSLCSLKRVRSL